MMTFELVLIAVLVPLFVHNLRIVLRLRKAIRQKQP
jgi:hypothetical protein